MMMYMASKALRDSMLPHQGGWSISEAILTAGQATADNLPAGLAEIQYMIRVPTIAMAEQATAVLDAQCRSRRQDDRLPVRAPLGVEVAAGARQPRHGAHRLRGASKRSVRRAGMNAPRRSRGKSRRMPASSRWPSRSSPECERLIAPEEAEAILRRDLPPSQLNSTSDDYTEMSWHAPTARVYVARPALKAPDGFAYPSWVMNALGGIPETIDPMVVCAAKTVALSALRLHRGQGRARADAKHEFVERTGGGIGGERWLAPLCDYEPPIHFRWPEYVTTPRGRDWWIPTVPNA